MISFRGRVVLLDIEGTLSPLPFVRDVLFPYARREVAGFLRERLSKGRLDDVVRQMARDDGAASAEAWCPHPWDRTEAADWIAGRAVEWMDADRKWTGLKELQGLIWERGFQDGSLRAPVFPDVVAGLRRFRAAGLSTRIYSSGSIAAQKLLFGHTDAGDLCPLFDAHYDTTSGTKRAAESYRRIARDCGVEPGAILFLSDVGAELDAAAEAGLAVGWMVRPDNAPETGVRHPRATSLDQVEVAAA